MARVRSSPPLRGAPGRQTGPPSPAGRRPPVRGRLSSGPVVLLAACLVLPLLAVRQVCASFDWRLLAAAGALISAVTWQLHAADKRSAAAGGWRTPEATLHLAEFAGGWPAAFIAMRMLRHKTAKLPYQIVYWSIVLVHQLVALDCLLGWSLTRRAAAVFSLSAA